MPLPIPYNPVQDVQHWQNEHGFIDSFQNPAQHPVADVATRGLVGAGLGATAGALADKNPWVMGAGTGTGTLAGYLAAKYLGGNAAEGDQGMYNTLGSLLGGGIGYGLTDYLQPKKKKKFDFSIPLPAGATIGVKTAGFKDFLRSAYGQLPTPRLLDTVVGGGLGAAGGLAYDSLKEERKLNKKDKQRKLWNRIIGGAGLGAIGGNVAMDRMRRYVSNNQGVFGYGAENQDPTASLKPKNLKQIWDSAILDKPQQPDVQAYMRGEYQAPNTPSATLPFGNTRANEAARYELNRRMLGLHTADPTKDIWSKQPDNSLSLNPEHKNIQNLVQEFMYPQLQQGFNQSRLLLNPMGAIGDINQKYNPASKPGMMQEIVGGQRIGTYPYTNPTTNQPDYLAKIQDRWKLGLNTAEQKEFSDYLKQKYMGIGPENPNFKPLSLYQQNMTEGQYVKSNLQRLFYDKVLAKEAPWVSQRAYFHNVQIPTPDKLVPSKRNPGQMDKVPSEPISAYGMVPTTATGRPYPGNTVGLLDPNTTDISFRDAASIIPQLSKNEEFKYPADLLLNR